MKQIPVVALAGLMSTSAFAWECDNERRIERSLDLSGADTLDIIAAAGDLVIRGESGTREATVVGRVCASKEEWADEADVIAESGDPARIAVVLPDVNWNVSWNGSRYVYIDLEITVPDDVAIELKDSSGDIEISGTAGLSIRDSSGDIEIEDVHGLVTLEDSSGDVEVERLDGDLVVEHDSSGDLRGRDITGSVLVKKDSSGDIRFRDVQSDMVVERDSSGDIVADTVGGDFRVLKDGSGDIRHSDVAGEVQVPDKG